MRLLYLDPDAQYMNPTAALLPVLLMSQFPGMSFYGPGFTSAQELAGGLRRWVDANGPFDAVIIGMMTPFFTNNDSGHATTVDFVLRYTVHPPFDGATLARYFKDVLGSLPSLPVPLKLVSSLNLDTYTSTPAQVDAVLESGVIVLGPNHQLLRPFAEWPEGIVEREARYRSKRNRLSDAWFDFLTAYPERVVTACHYVAAHEFCATALAERRWDMAVPGVEYALRRDALASLRSAGVTLAPKGYFHVFRVANRIGLPVFRQPVALRLYNHLFQRTLCTSRIVYTAPGGSGIVLRKFFEIPAAGAVLACVPCNGFAALGFEHGRNYVALRPTEVGDAVLALRRNAGLQRIATAGQHLTMTRHSLRARGAQIAQCLAALRAGTYQGARWDGGEFVVTPAQVAA